MSITWLELSKVADGTRVSFTEAHDIFPDCVVPAGTVATIKENSLNEISEAILVKPDDVRLQKSLRDWDGCIYLPVAVDPISGEASWSDKSPLQLVA